MKRPITSRMHGMLDYPAGIALIAAPWIFGFSDVGGAAVAVPVALGILILLQSLITDYEFSIAKVLPLAAHLAIDAAGGILLALTPVIWKTTDDGTGAWLPHVIVGLGLIAAALLTRPERSLRTETADQHRASHQRTTPNAF
jgi:hypothetical protein